MDSPSLNIPIFLTHGNLLLQDFVSFCMLLPYFESFFKLQDAFCYFLHASPVLGFYWTPLLSVGYVVYFCVINI